MKRNAILVSLIGLLLLSACADSDADKPADKVDDKADVAEKAPKVTPICPQVAIIRDLQDIRDYGAEDPSPDQLVARAHMKAIEGDCAYIKDGIDVRFSLDFVAARGARLGGLQASFPYFIAVIDPDDHVLNKDRMTEAFHFSSNAPTVEASENLHVFIPLPKDKISTGSDYRVLVGFQLTQEQLSVVRKR